MASAAPTVMPAAQRSRGPLAIQRKKLEPIERMRPHAPTQMGAVGVKERKSQTWVKRKRAGDSIQSVNRSRTMKIIVTSA